MGGERYRMAWTDEEDAALLRHYKAEGAAWGGWRYLLPGRTQNAIRKRATQLGVAVRRRRRARPWDEIEDRLVLNAALELSRETGRSVGAIGGRIAALAHIARERGKR